MRKFLQQICGGESSKKKRSPPTIKSPNDIVRLGSQISGPPQADSQLPPPSALLRPPAELPNTTAISAVAVASVRFNLVDAFVKFQLRVPASYKVTQVQVNSDVGNENGWRTVQHEEAVAKFHLVTVELEPSTQYQVKCIIQATPRPDQPAVTIETPPVQITTKNRMELLYDYEANRDFEKRVDHEVSFKEGDTLAAMRGFMQDCPSDYRYVQNKRTNETGLAPFICLDKLESYTGPAIYHRQSYFFVKTDRHDAAVILMQPHIEKGVFFLRPSADGIAENCIALSVRTGAENGIPTQRKFKIYILTDGYGCFIFPSKTFEDIKALIAYYQEHDIQAGVKLGHPFIPPGERGGSLKLEDIKIPKSGVQQGEKLGNGKFGNVYKGKIKNIEVAIKELIISEKENTEDDVDSSKLLEEALTMAQLFHDNVVRFIAVCVDEAPFWLVSEFMNCGSLKTYLKQTEVREWIDFELVIFILRQIVNGMAYLETKKYIHRDLRADNVLIHQEDGGSLQVKIADFGLSRIVPEDIYVPSNPLLPIRWTAPEAMRKFEFSLKSDVWSFGIISFEVCTLGSIPYPSIQTNREVQQAVQSGQVMTIEECQRIDKALCPEPLYQVMKDCWQLNPDKRPHFAGLKSLFDNFSVSTEIQYADDDGFLDQLQI